MRSDGDGGNDRFLDALQFSGLISTDVQNVVIILLYRYTAFPQEENLQAREGLSESISINSVYITEKGRKHMTY